MPEDFEEKTVTYDDINLDEVLGQEKKTSKKSKSGANISPATKKSILKKINKN